jgi:biopolymer transport protein ExbD
VKRSRIGRRLHRRLRHTQAPAGLLNLTSMIDILTVLLFFLLVYSADLAIFTPMSVLDLNLPAQQATQPPTPPPMQLEVYISPAELQVVRDGTITSRVPRRNDGSDYATLGRVLADLKSRSPDTEQITVRPDANVAYDVLVQVMDTARQLPPSAGGQPLFPQIQIGDAPMGALP